jgi:RHS repeat-associated protein
VIALADDSGAARTVYAYDPFGSVTVSGEASDNTFQYTGRENDGTGLYYYRARYYSPELQRFISRDPIGLSGGDVNFYRYVGNDPVKFRDSLGLQCGPGVWDYVIPDSWWGKYNFQKACQKHDNCYDKCGSKKSDCDLDFYFSMLEECSKLKGYWRDDCNFTALFYYWSVDSKMGNYFYNKAQGK